jgi:hypothetical protein
LGREAEKRGRGAEKKDRRAQKMAGERRGQRKKALGGVGLVRYRVAGHSVR